MKKKATPLEVATRGPDQLGHALKRFRNRENLSQESLAKSAGIRQATVSKLENGSGASEINTIFAACAALDLEIVLRERKRHKHPQSIEELFR